MAQSGGSSQFQPLYGPWIDKALQSNDANEMRKVLQEARKHFPARPQPLYAVWIHHCIESGTSREDLEKLLAEAKATQSSDMKAAIDKLELHLGKK